MTDRVPVLPSKTMSEHDRSFLKVAGQELAQTPLGGANAMAVLLEIVASWHGWRHPIGFHDYGQRWLLEGNCTNKATDRLLRVLFGLDGPSPTPRRIRRAA